MQRTIVKLHIKKTYVTYFKLIYARLFFQDGVEKINLVMNICIILSA